MVLTASLDRTQEVGGSISPGTESPLGLGREVQRLDWEVWA